MCKALRLTIIFFIVLAAVSVSSKSHAIPAFARQMGLSCAGCHFQHFPELNAFGRAFKANGYTMAGGPTSLIEDEGLSLPTVLNAAFVTKFRYVKENGSDKILVDPALPYDPDTNPQVDTPRNTGLLNFPDEASIFLAGRAGEHVGFITEWGDAGVANFRMPIGFAVGDGNLSVIPFTTDALGAQAGFELLNTGAVGNIRAFEDGKQVMSAQRYIGTTDSDTGTAEGLALVYANGMGFVNATVWTPQHAGAGGDAPVKSWSHYLRAALTPSVSGWDLGIGVQYWGGTSETNGSVALNGGPLTKADTKALGIDAQAMGTVAGMPLGVFFSYGKADASSAAGTPNLFNPNNNDKTATSISAELGVLPNKLTLGLGYRAGNNGEASNSSDNAYAVAAIYKLAQNIQIGLTQTMMSGDANGIAVTNPDGSNGKTADAQTMVNVFAAF